MAGTNTTQNVESLKETVREKAESIDTSQIQNTANDAVTSFKNAGENVSGQVAGLVQGGIQSLTQKADAFKQDVTDAKDTVEGLLSGDTTSLENMGTDMVNNAIQGLLSKFGAKVEVSFSEPDSDGIVTPISSSLSTDTTGADKIQGILSLITGLGVDVGNLQSITAVASPEGLLNAGKEFAEGKIGAFDGASAISGLVDGAITGVADQLNQQVGGALAAVSNVNKTVSRITSIDSDGFGELVYTKVADVVSGGPTDSAEFNSAITNATNAIPDIETLVTKADEIKQNLVGAKTDLSNLSGGKDGGEVLASVQNQAAKRSEYTKKADEYKGIVRTRVAGNSGRGIIQSISTETLTTIQKQVKAFAPSISDADTERVIALSQGDRVDESTAVKILYQLTQKDVNVIKTFLNSIDTTIASATKAELSEVVFEDPYVIGSYLKGWKQGADDPDFPYVSSVEELQAEVAKIDRELTEVIVHWTETATNKNIGSEEINGWHLAAGLEGIGYHYVIRRDGSLQRGRPVNIAGQHTPARDDKSLGIVFVGGVNVPTGTPNFENFLSAQSLTRSQLNTFDQMVRTIYRVYSGINFFGHVDVDPTGESIDPGFDVPDYVRTRFGKEQA